MAYTIVDNLYYYLDKYNCEIYSDEDYSSIIIYIHKQTTEKEIKSEINQALKSFDEYQIDSIGISSDLTVIEISK